MDRLLEITEQIGQQKWPPVHLWEPERHASIDIQIDAQGFWFHEGSGFQRDELVRLFASILWYEDGQYYLVTPAEKLTIEVADVPFVVHQMEAVDDAWVAVTNTHEQLIIGFEHPVELRMYNDQLVPYVRVRYDLWARVNRSIYYQWVTAAMELQAGDKDPLILTSGEYQFEVARD